PLFPYTTLFRSDEDLAIGEALDGHIAEWQPHVLRDLLGQWPVGGAGEEEERAPELVVGHSFAASDVFSSAERKQPFKLDGATRGCQRARRGRASAPGCPDRCGGSGRVVGVREQPTGGPHAPSSEPDSRERMGARAVGRWASARRAMARW